MTNHRLHQVLWRPTERPDLAPNRRPSILTFIRSLACLTLLLIIGLGSPRVVVAHPATSTGPVLDAVVVSTNAPGVVIVSGQGFTPLGRVYIAVYDRWGTTLHETRVVTTTETLLQPPDFAATGGRFAEEFTVEVGGTEGAAGTQTPAPGTTPGTPTAIANDPCPMPLMVRAYDRATATWSNIVDVELGC
jgi:hypothetical protein